MPAACSTLKNQQTCQKFGKKCRKPETRIPGTCLIRHYLSEVHCTSCLILQDIFVFSSAERPRGASKFFFRIRLFKIWSHVSILFRIWINYKYNGKQLCWDILGKCSKISCANLWNIWEVGSDKKFVKFIYVHQSYDDKVGSSFKRFFFGNFHKNVAIFKFFYFSYSKIWSHFTEMPKNKFLSNVGQIFFSCWISVSRIICIGWKVF